MSAESVHDSVMVYLVLLMTSAPLQPSTYGQQNNHALHTNIYKCTITNTLGAGISQVDLEASPLNPEVESIERCGL